MTVLLSLGAAPAMGQTAGEGQSSPLDHWRVDLAAGDPFVQDKPGLGLGLPLANMQIRQHGGQLEIVSEDGKGTTATICIPAERTLSRVDGEATSPVG